MRITCRCSSCGGTYQVDGQYAGRKIKCPKCSAVIVVAAVAEAKASRRPRRGSPRGPQSLESRGKDRVRRPLPPEPGWSRKPSNDRPRPPSRAWVRGARAGRLGRGGGARAGGDRPQAGRGGRFATRKHHGRRRRPTTAGCGLPSAWECALAIAAVVVVVAILPTSRVGQDRLPHGPIPSKGRNHAATAPQPAAAAEAVDEVGLELAGVGAGGRRGLHRRQRHGGAEDGPGRVPAGNPRRLAHDPHHPQGLSYAGVPQAVALEGETLPPYAVRWFRSFDAWVQDFEKAKRLAAVGKKSHLDRLRQFGRGAEHRAVDAGVIFSKEEFLKGPGKDCVLMYVDFPQTSEGGPR